MKQKRSYSQYCSLARALDIVGERWTLLLIRDLMAGPRRYKELLESFPSMGTNLLATRLKHLEREGLVAQITLPSPHAIKTYQLTARGKALEPTLIALANWGLPFLEEEQGGDLWRPQWNHIAMRARFNPQAAAGLSAVYAYHIDNYPYYAVVADGKLETFEGHTHQSDCSLRCSSETFLKVFVQGTQSLDEAVAAGELEIEGDRQTLIRGLAIFQPSPTQ